MNMQAMMQKAQKLQKDMVVAKKEIEEKSFFGKSGLVEVEVNGKKEVLKVEIKEKHEINKEDLDILEDMFIVATNEAIKNAEKEMEEKMNQISPGLNGMF